MKAEQITKGRLVKTSAAWHHGVNSVRNPWTLQEDQFKWGVNVTVRGGIVQTRPGYAMRLSLPPGNLQGGTIFSANKIAQAASTTITSNGIEVTTEQTIYNYLGNTSLETELTYIVFSVDGSVYFAPFPLTQPKDWNEYKLTNIALDKTVKQVYFNIATQSATITAGGNVTVTPSHRVLVIQDGINSPGYWDGSDSTGQISSNIPIGTWMAYSGNRLWVANGNIVAASDLANPLSWTERTQGAGRGDFSFPRPVTGMVDYIGQNNDTRLYVFTDQSSYSLASGVLDRAQWSSTSNFQSTLYPNLGCVAGNSITFQSGLMWWYSEGGLVSSDVASTSYLSSQVLYKDVEMAKAKRFMAADTSGICATSFENYVLCSIPYLEPLNSATMVLDYNPASEWTQSRIPAWSGVWTGTRPVNWATKIINNQPRVYQFSVDYAPTNDGSFNHLWEAFVPGQQDSYLDIQSDGSVRELYNRIYGQMETALLGDLMDLKQFVYGEIECTQIAGDVDVQVGFRGSKGPYTQVLSTKLQAVNYPYQYDSSYDKDAVNDLGFLRTQYRRLITETRQRDLAASSCESKYTLDIDKAFSFLIEWCGQFGVEAVRIFMDPWSEKSTGNPNYDELKACVVSEEGISQSLNLLPAIEEQQTPTLSWSSTQTVTIPGYCKASPTVVKATATATATSVSFISLADAANQAKAKATDQATVSINQYLTSNC
jgi:hypothetical protein